AGVVLVEAANESAEAVHWLVVDHRTLLRPAAHHGQPEGEIVLAGGYQQRVLGAAAFGGRVDGRSFRENAPQNFCEANGIRVPARFLSERGDPQVDRLGRRGGTGGTEQEGARIGQGEDQLPHCSSPRVCRFWPAGW